MKIIFITFPSFMKVVLQRPDYQFQRNVKLQKSTEFDYKLYKTEKLVEKINVFQFDREKILNFDLVEFLLSSNKQKEKREHLFTQLKNEFSYFYPAGSMDLLTSQINWIYL